MKPKKGQNQEKNRIETMYQEYFTSLMVIACSYTHDRTEAEDLVQDVFVKALLSYRREIKFQKILMQARVDRADNPA